MLMKGIISFFFIVANNIEDSFEIIRPFLKAMFLITITLFLE